MAFITNFEGNFFTQEMRREEFDWLTCTGVGDLDMPRAEPTAQYCPDPLSSGQFRLEGFTSGGAPGAGTYSLVKPLLAAWNALLHINCPFVGRINWVCRGLRQDPRNYEVAVLMLDSNPRRQGIVNPVAGPASGTPEEARVDTNADALFARLMVIYRLAWAQIEMDNTADALSIYFLPFRCEDRTGPGRRMCEEGIMGLVGPGGYLYEGEIKKTFDGATWDATLVDPYTWGGDTGAVLMFETVDTVRWLVFRTEAVVGAPAEVGISEDSGASWQNIEIGNAFGEFVTATEVVGGDVMVVTNFGSVYRSRNQGETWVRVFVGPGTALNAICFFDDKYGYAVGDGNVLLRTRGGSGGTWDAMAGPAPAPAGVNLLCVDTNDMGHVFVGTDDARLFRSEDQADPAEWEEWIDLGGGTIDWIGFDPNGHYVGLLLYNPPDPVTDQGYAYRSEDGGASWVRMVGMPDNNGLNSAFMCDQNTYYTVGQVEAGFTFVARTEIA